MQDMAKVNTCSCHARLKKTNKHAWKCAFLFHVPIAANQWKKGATTSFLMNSNPMSLTLFLEFPFIYALSLSWRGVSSELLDKNNDKAFMFQSVLGK